MGLILIEYLAQKIDMTPFKSLLFVLTASVLISSCGNALKKAESSFSLEFKGDLKNQAVSNPLALEVINKDGLAVDSVAYLIDGIRVSGASNIEATTINIPDGRVGERLITAKIYSSGNTYSASNAVILYGDQVPTLYKYNILESYPHDIKAFTQGIEFVGDTLYESTGQLGKSTLRKVDYLSGTVVQKINLDNRLFGEGLTVKDGKVYQLTWKNRKGFVYNQETLKTQQTFYYNKSKEGWGLCNDGTTIYKSDGTHKIWKLDPETLLETDYIEIYTNTSKIDNINELEFIDGKIYANVWQKDAIAIINPATGVVEGVINTKTLKDQVSQHPELDVLNGIAYKGEPGTLFLTGKNWDKLFKVSIEKN